ncbi:hypothetical protein R2360_11270 [Mycobacteroides chelonae]|uniref:Uncharacterized protein n=1 Tax=Mycobacteroides chelonae TaxID=1774 RepID=A0AB73U271_MYCCH|nr:hypothetical protein [Mycobacteroides chelonae]MBF9352154.1 hypothetical protein [Mycobacteroides chelonae]MEC4840097.1 hypothetical protein [Mycobacteroides chelonae]MEC4843776.1 hypothetical protein [Mycobacteroides chelonae]OHU39739.1 hypothetical protein BKG80_08730 [Mycobacteroides chelonae]OHU50809.1 hypothetical protein BKG81_09540 [Mycobacteroides chelonae]
MTLNMTLNDIARLDFTELGVLYQNGTVPADLHVLGEKPDGRQLAMRGRDHGISAKIVRYFADPRRAVWIGKRLSVIDNGLSGKGSNRMRFGRDVFPYIVRIDASILDGHDAIVFDYNHAGNNAIGRRLYNEIRQVAPGIFVGAITWKTRRNTRTHLGWFGLTADLGSLHSIDTD